MAQERADDHRREDLTRREFRDFVLKGNLLQLAVIKLLKRDVVSQEIVENWLKQVVPDARFNGPLPNVHIQYINTRNCLRRLLFQAQGGLAEGQISLIEAAHDALPDR